MYFPRRASLPDCGQKNGIPKYGEQFEFVLLVARMACRSLERCFAVQRRVHCPQMELHARVSKPVVICATAN